MFTRRISTIKSCAVTRTLLANHKASQGTSSVTTAATLHTHGITKIATASQAAEALKPLAGKGAYWLFTLGLIGTGMLGVPVLAGSSAYAIAEAKSWGASLDRKPALAPKFYGVLAVAMVLGVALDRVGLDAVKMIFWSAVAN